MNGLKKGENSKGFTYAELVICMVVIAIIVGPICVSFASANKIRATSEALNESITHTEALMEAIKAQLTDDIKIKKQKEANQILSVVTTAQTGIKLCLEDVYTDTTPLDKKPLTDFLVNIDDKKFNDLYETNRYAYEIAIWRGDNIDFSVDTLAFEGRTLNRAAKIYSSPTYQFGSYSTSSGNINFTISDAFKSSFWKTRLTYIPAEGYSVLDEHTITLTQDGMQAVKNLSSDVGAISSISTKNTIDIGAPTVIKNEDGVLESLIYESTTTGAYVADALNVIDVDIRQLIRKGNLGNTALENNAVDDNLTLKFINNTKQDQVVRIIRSASEGIDTLEDIDKKFNIIIIDKKSGKTSIQRIEQPSNTENFIIAIVARDMTPVIGKPGKVVKKMIDVYSYEIGNN